MRRSRSDWDYPIDFILIVLSLVAVSVCALPGCAFSTDPLDPGREGQGAAGSVAVSVQALTPGDWNVNNTNRNMRRPGRTTALAAVMRGAFPQCVFRCQATTDGISYCDGCGQRIYTSGCETTGDNAERCGLGIGFVTAGYMQWGTTSPPNPDGSWDGSGRWGGCPNNVFAMDELKTRVFPYCER
jgi:hypothetical protein